MRIVLGRVAFAVPALVRGICGGPGQRIPAQQTAGLSITPRACWGCWKLHWVTFSNRCGYPPWRYAWCPIPRFPFLYRFLEFFSGSRFPAGGWRWLLCPGRGSPGHSQVEVGQQHHAGRFSGVSYPVSFALLSVLNRSTCPYLATFRSLSARFVERFCCCCRFWFMLQPSFPPPLGAAPSPRAWHLPLFSYRFINGMKDSARPDSTLSPPWAG